jgi:hypothetical protein
MGKQCAWVFKIHQFFCECCICEGSFICSLEFGFARKIVGNIEGGLKQFTIIKSLAQKQVVNEAKVDSWR